MGKKKCSQKLNFTSPHKSASHMFFLGGFNPVCGNADIRRLVGRDFFYIDTTNMKSELLKCQNSKSRHCWAVASTFSPCFSCF